MALFSTIKRFAASVGKEFAQAGRSFSSLVSEVKKYVPFTDSYENRLSFREQEEWERARKVAKFQNPNRFVSGEARVKTINNLSKNYQYIFKARVVFEDGLVKADPHVSVLSDTRLTPNKAKEALIKNLFSKESYYGRKISNITNIELQAERRDVTFP